MRICPVTGLEIEYSGRGRPPVYHPSAKAQVQSARAKKYREARRAKREAALSGLAG